ncbi:hypothetical protein NPIL_328641 [Nephila pilipes]|uniref:Uncharacterized protein n=1 Tax=Nephila pilipes TaxID=299642 RepID=A0A8X6PGT7_NEPPI|nr:hypothetical protein NPIL_328641 [Nephila pilipes]
MRLISRSVLSLYGRNVKLELFVEQARKRRHKFALRNFPRPCLPTWPPTNCSPNSEKKFVLNSRFSFGCRSVYRGTSMPIFVRTRCTVTCLGEIDIFPCPISGASMLARAGKVIMQNP